jgi:hypothetical protein
VANEALTPAGASPHVATLANRATKRREDTVVYKILNNIRTPLLQSHFSFRPAVVTGTASAAVDMSGAGQALAVELDGLPALTVWFQYNATPAVSVTGHQVTVARTFSGTAGDAASITQIAEALNIAFFAADPYGYGAAYGSANGSTGAASVSGGFLRITSPIASPMSDVQVFAPVANSGLNDIMGAAGATNRNAQSVLVIADQVWNGNASWAVDYVRRSATTDTLEQAPNVLDVAAVGSTPGTQNFTESLDWTADTSQVAWTSSTAAVVTGPVFTDVDVGTNNNVTLAVDGKPSAISGSADITFNVATAVPPPLGFVAPGTPTAATPSEIANNINAYLALHLGPRYRAVAAATDHITLTSPTLGRAGSSIKVTQSGSAPFPVGLLGGAIERAGTGKKPVEGAVYFVSYDFTRPLADYGVPFRHFSVEAMHTQVGLPSPAVASYNPLAIAAEIAFQNGAEAVYTIQVNDLVEGNPSRAQVKSALDAASTVRGATEIVVVGEPGTRLDVVADVVDHLEVENGPSEKNYRRAFFGMAANTSIGDRDTVDSLVGRATSTLQVGAASPARGRMFLVAPPQLSGVSRTVVFADGSEASIALDGTYLAVAVAARRTALQSPADTLTRRTIVGFNLDDVTLPWKPVERRALASQGVFVITYDAGRMVMLDAMSTEGGGGGKESFKVDSTSYQKDIITAKVNRALDENLIGIVPFDLASFILDIKLVIQGVLANEISVGTIGPFRDQATGAVRSIDLRTDIKVEQNVNNPTQFSFAYWYNLRYPGLRFFGEYSVDNPFFSLGA